MVIRSSVDNILIATNGTKGQPGPAGTSSYIHIKYSNDGGRTFTDNDGETIGAYIGIYRDFTEDDSSKVTDYKWKKIEGEDGADAYTVMLSNENFTISTDTNYVPIHTQTFRCNIVVLKGADPADFTITAAADTENDIVTTISGHTVTIKVATVEALTEPQGTITLTINVDNQSFAKDITWTVATQGVDGQTGVSITDVTNYYLATLADSGVTKETPGWTTEIQNMTEHDPYLWNYEVITGSNGQVISSTEPVIIGRYGRDGDAAAEGRGIYSIVEHYQVSSSNTEPPTTWSDVPIPTDEVNKYLWNYETITYTDNTSEDTQKRVIGTQGETGSTGATGRGVSSITEYFLLSDTDDFSKIVFPEETDKHGWTTIGEALIWSKNKPYLWHCTEIIYENPSETIYTDKYCDTSWKAADLVQANLTSFQQGVDNVIDRDNQSIRSAVWENTYTYKPKKDAEGNYVYDDDGKIVPDEDSKTTMSEYMAESIVDRDGIRTKVEEAESSIDGLERKSSEIEQTADKINWVVKSGSSESNVTLTDSAINAVTNQFIIKDPQGNATIIEGGKINANAITADMITANNLVGDHGWINLKDGKFYYGDDSTFETSDNAISWNGSKLQIKADEFLLASGKSIFDEIDAIETWFYAEAPTTSNEPAKNWTTDNLKEMHLRDVYFDTNTGKSYRWAKDGTTYKWVEIEDKELAAVEGRIASAETQITANKTAIEARATKTEIANTYATKDSVPKNVSDLSDADNYATKKYADDAAGTAETNAKNDTTERLKSYYTTTQTDAKISETAEGITSTVNKIEKKMAGNYATSATGAGTKTKVATIIPAVTGWELYEGASITVKFTNANTNTAPNLNVNSTGAKPIKSYNGNALTENEYKWIAGSTMTFVYDGTNWRIQDSAELIRLNTAETNISQNATDIELRATKTELTNAISQEVKDRDAAIKLSADGITSTVSSNYTTKTDFNDYKSSNDDAVADAKKAGTDAQSDLDSYKKTVTNTYASKTELTQTESSLEGKISTAQTTVTEYADGLIEKEVTDRNAAITASADGIISTVTETINKNSSVVNLLPSIYFRENESGNVWTYKGITWTLNPDGSVTATGTATDVSNYYFTGTSLGQDIPILTIDPDKNYILHGCPEGGSGSTYALRGRWSSVDDTPAAETGMDTGNGNKNNIEKKRKYVAVFATIFANYTCPDGGITFYPMLETGETKSGYISSKSNAATKKNISTITEAADRLSGRVTAIEDDYLSSAELAITSTGITGTVGDKINDIFETQQDATSKYEASNDGFTILWNHSSLTSVSDGQAYVCAREPLTGVVSNTNGWVMFNGVKRTVPSTLINTGSVLPFNTTIYIVLRLNNKTAIAGTMYLVWYNAGWKYSTPSPTAVSGDFSWDYTNDTDIILGSFVKPGANKTLADIQVYHPARNARQKTNADSAYSMIEQTANSIKTIVSSNTVVVNLLPPIYYREFLSGKNYVNNGITWTTNPDGSVTATGTATASSTYYFTGTALTNDVPVMVIDQTRTYIVHGCPAGGSTDTYSLRARWTLGTATPSSSSGKITYDVGEGTSPENTDGRKYLAVWAYINEGYACPADGLTFYPMVEIGDVVHGYVSNHSNATMEKLNSTIEQLPDSIESTVSKQYITNLVNDVYETQEDAANKFNASNDGYTILWNHSALKTTKNGSAFICSRDPMTGAMANSNGWVMFNGVKRTVSPTLIDPNDVLPFNTTIYIVLRLSSATSTTGTMYLVWYDGGWKSSSTAPTAVDSAAWSWNYTNDTDIILGSFVEPGSEQTLADIQIFTPARTARQKTTAESAYSKITQTADSITLSVSKTYETKTDASNKLTEAKNDATSKANAAEKNAKDDTTEKLKSYYTATQTDSQIEQKADEISTRVSEQKISELEIGGRNLLIGTPMSEYVDIVGYTDTDFTKHFRWYNGNAQKHTFEEISSGIYQDTILLNVASNLGVSFARLASEIDLDSDSYYTLSCMAKCSNADKSLCIGTSYYTTANAWVWRGGKNPFKFNEANKWQKFTLTFKPDADTQAINYCFTVAGVADGTDTFTIKNCKLEKGSKATAWTPAPEDTTSYTNTVVESAETRINQTISEITASVENIEIGGANLIHDSGDMGKWLITTDCDVEDNIFHVKTTSANARFADGWVTDSYEDIKGKTLTLSMEVKKSASTEAAGLYSAIFSTSDSYVSKSSGTLTYGKRRITYLSGFTNADKINTDTWTRIYITYDNFDFTESTYNLYDYVGIRIGARNTAVGNEGWFRNVKLEYGNRPTAFSTANEDVLRTMRTEMTETADGITATIASVSTDLLSAKEDISTANNNISDVNDRVDSIDTIINGDGTTENLGLSNRLATIEATANSVDYNFTNLNTNITNYFSFGSDGVLTLGKNGSDGSDASPFKTELSNEKISFKQDGTEIAYMSGNVLHISDAEIMTTLRIGNFIFVPRTNGNMSLKYSPLSQEGE